MAAMEIANFTHHRQQVRRWNGYILLCRGGADRQGGSGMLHKRSSVLILFACALCASIGLSGCDLLAGLFGGSSEDGSIHLDSISPREGLMNETLSVSIIGNPLSADMSPNLQVKLINGAVVLLGSRFNSVTGGQVVGEFTLSAPDPMTMDLYVVDDDGDEGYLSAAFTVNEYEVLKGPMSSPVSLDLSTGDVSYDFSEGGTCVTTSSARDATFILAGDPSVPAMTITSGGQGGIYYYSSPDFTSLDLASDLQSNITNYERSGAITLPRTLSVGQFYSLLSVGGQDEFIVLKIEGVDATNQTIDFNYMRIRMIATES
jgi:hypothetical protein